MKKIYQLISVAALLFAGCTEAPETDMIQGLGAEIKLGGEINQQYVSRVNDGGFCEGDKIGVYVVQYENDTTPGELLDNNNYADNVRYTLADQNSNTWIGDQTLYYPKNKIDIYGYYPYSSISSVSAQIFEVQKDQSTESSSTTLGGYEASDFLWGKAQAVSESTSKVNITFSHIMSAVEITLSKGEGWTDEEWTQVEKQALVINTKRNSTIDLRTGEVTATGAIQNTGIIACKKNDTTFRAVVVPQQIAASTPVLNITIGGKSLLYTPDVPTEYSAGRQLNISLGVNKPQSGEGLELELLSSTISPWENDGISHNAAFSEYFVVNCTEAGTLKECIEAKGQDLTKIKNLKVTGTIDMRDFTIMDSWMKALQAIHLKEVTIAPFVGDDAGCIPGYAFSGKSLLTRFVFPDRLQKIGGYAFENTSLTGSLIIPEGVTEIGGGAFYQCKSLSGTLTLPKSLVTIERYAFYACSGLCGTLNIPEGVTKIEREAFCHCSGFTGQLILPENLKTLESMVFYCCSGFTGDLVIPNKVTKIDNSAFGECSGLNGQLSLPEGLLTIGSNAFVYCRFTGELVLPKTLVKIDGGAFGDCKFTGELIIPGSVQSIGSGVFWGNKFSGTVEIPEGVSMIPNDCFNQCMQLEKVILPSTIENIQGNAFGYCYALKEIVCKSNSVPFTNSSAFNGVPYTAVVKVPSASLNDYKTASPWNQYAQNMVPYYNLSLDRDLIQLLNAEESVTVALTCEQKEAWEIQSKPEWATVSPASGVGPKEITITVSALAAGSATRNGEVVVKLSDENKDCRVAVAIDQYNYQTSGVQSGEEAYHSGTENPIESGESFGDGDYLKIQSHTLGSGVTLVFMGEGYTASEITSGKYLQNMRTAAQHFFNVEPYNTYREYFDVYAILARSDDSGIFGPNDKKHKTKFKGKYEKGIGYQPDEAICFDYVIRLPHIGESKLNEVLVTLVMNTSEYSGVTHMWSDGKAISCVPVSNRAYPYDFRGYVQHESCGHGFGKLGDEDVSLMGNLQQSSAYQDFKTQKSYGWLENLADNANRKKVPWAVFLDDAAYNQIVDLYEGGYGYASGVYRSEQNSCMNNFVPYFSAVSRMAIVKRILSIAKEDFSYESFKEKDVKEAITPSTSSLRAVTGDNHIAPRLVKNSNR